MNQSKNQLHQLHISTAACKAVAKEQQQQLPQHLARSMS
jgi:hypothetical protein